MKKILFLFVLLLPAVLSAQKSTVKVIVTDFATKETIPNAKVRLNDQIKGTADIDGVILFEGVPYGNYTLTASLEDTLSKTVKIDKPELTFTMALGSTLELEEVQVIGGVVVGRRTPVPVTKIDPKKIEEELGSRDIPMLLNATPGVYATQQGGGDGDARITVRGFSQRNVGVMIDGVPVNDMENGAVYWSNWFGLDVITQNIQVQRGLGATKLSMPSVGGSINILTAGVGNKQRTTIKQEYGSGNMLRTSVAYNSGMMKGGWGITLAGSYKQADGWVDGTPSQGGFYYAKVQKKIKNHLLSFSAFGAPQKHGQRSFNQKIPYWSKEDADKYGVAYNGNGTFDVGIRYNEHWGYVSAHSNSNTVNRKGRTIMNERLNYYNKNQLTLKDFWQVNSKLSISNIVYSSIGKGGGTKLSNYSSALRAQDGTIDWDRIINNNQYVTFFGTIKPNYDPYFSPDEYKSSQVLTSSVNNHSWIGYLGQFSYEMNPQWSFSGGLDYRYYKGVHYREIVDLLGGDYYVNPANQNSTSQMKRVGDKIADGGKPYENDRAGYVQWAGIFGQAEYTGTRWTAFLNLTGVYNGYKGVDYFNKKELDLGDTVLRIGAADTINYNGQTYTASSDGLKYQSTGYKWVPGGTVKAGASYILNENSNLFLNIGYLSRTPMFTSVVDNNYNRFFAEVKNEIITALELGYGYASKKFAVNVNVYATNWKNKPFPNGLAVPDPLDPQSTIRVNVQGMDAVHYGAEIDGVYKINKMLSAEASVSYGDWRWNSSKTVELPAYNTTISFDAKGVHVGDAPQSTYAGAIRFEPIKNLYFKVQYMYFDRFYSEFNPFILNGANAGRDSWKAPGYGLLNVFAGYKHFFKNRNAMGINGNITNVLNKRYISDANLSSTYGPGFDVNSVGVMYGQGLRFNLALSFDF